MKTEHVTNLDNLCNECEDYLNTSGPIFYHSPDSELPPKVILSEPTFRMIFLTLTQLAIEGVNLTQFLKRGIEEDPNINNDEKTEVFNSLHNFLLRFGICPSLYANEDLN